MQDKENLITEFPIGSCLSVFTSGFGMKPISNESQQRIAH